VRVVLDTNILLAALISPGGGPARIYEAWKLGRFDLLTSAEQLGELGRVTRYPTVRPLITVSEAGRMVNQIRALATLVEPSCAPKVSSDPADDFLFAIAESAQADYIVTGDKTGVLKVRRYGDTRVLTVAQFVALLD
jgi:putative PIN family toxin of toxin-antitoxin system